MKKETKETIGKVFAVFILLGLLYATGSYFKLFSVAITWQYEQINPAPIDQITKGSTIPFDSLINNYATRLVAENKELKDPSKYTNLHPRIIEIERNWYNRTDGSQWGEIQVALDDGYVLNQVYGGADQAAGYKNNLLVRIGSVTDNSCVQTSVGQTSLQTKHEICSNIRGVEVYINKYREVQDITTQCTNGQTQTETCWNGSTVTLANCVDGSWVTTYKVCSRPPINVTDVNGTDVQCQVPDKIEITCTDGRKVTEATCVNNIWVSTNQTCTTGVQPTTCSDGDMEVVGCNGVDIPVLICQNGSWVNQNPVCEPGVVPPQPQKEEIDWGLILIYITLALIVLGAFYFMTSGKKKR